ncbi:AraC family transcriptional regulator [Oceanimonas doudoroffii]|uniref:AraC family transcriptional regulator n=1 Tax=Oceanimonas doudoroffii TaxID=84158 RepID=A0A233RH48_9GAMM|nr:helix-turn-helix transcriptional regulator [Oceanimonas doudoroffii]OXY82709.1 AraC family transcriptional regulator [Oceanimonas doudoroffii]
MGFSSPEDGSHALDLSLEEASGLPIFGVAVHYPAGHVVPMHTHSHGHLIYADRGLLRVEAESGQWLVPPTAAVWLRSGVEHRLVVPVALQAHGLFVHNDICARLPEADCVIHVSSLVRELIMALTQADKQSLSATRMGLLGELLIEEIHAQPALPFHLPWPAGNADSPIQRVCQSLLNNPGDVTTATGWADKLAMGDKTFHRRFLQSTGMTFGKWRQQLRLMSSLTLLLKGVPITQVALASGYESHSAYTTAFSKQFGQPPSVFSAKL